MTDNTPSLEAIYRGCWHKIREKRNELRQLIQLARAIKRAMDVEDELNAIRQAEAERSLTALELELLLPQEPTAFEIVPPPIPEAGFNVTSIFRGKLSEIKHAEDGHKYNVDPFKKDKE